MKCPGWISRWNWEKAFASHPEAWVNFKKLSCSHRREYAAWIQEAKKEEMRLLRAQKAAAMLLGCQITQP